MKDEELPEGAVSSDEEEKSGHRRDKDKDNVFADIDFSAPLRPDEQLPVRTHRISNSPNPSAASASKSGSKKKKKESTKERTSSVSITTIAIAILLLPRFLIAIVSFSHSNSIFPID